MAAGATPPRAPTALSSAGENRVDTARLDALDPSKPSPEAEHRAIARRLLAAGQADKAVAELIRFARERPMGARMASALTGLGLATGKLGPILTLVTQGVDEAEGRERIGVMRSLARLQRRTGQAQAAVETLTMLLAEAPEDRRARLVLNALLERFERWDELDASLDKETRLLLRRRYFRAASRVTVRRARLWGELRDEPARAALRYAQAAQFADQGQDPHSVFLLRLLWLRSLVHADAPARSVDEGVRVVLEAAARVGRDQRARAFLRELNVRLPPAALAAELEVTISLAAPAGQSVPVAPPVVAAPPEPETPTRGQVGEALLVAAATAPTATSATLAQLEARYVARGAWRELARFYRATADTRSEATERSSWLEKLAEVLESELDDGAGAAAVWAEVAQLTGDTQAVSEQVRLHEERDDGAAAKQALDAGVVRAQAPKEKARLLVLRAQEARTRGDTERARVDLEEALRTSPAELEAAAGLAELAVARGDSAPLRTFEKLLLGSSKRTPDRLALCRRLARTADDFRDARLALLAWGEVLTLAPHDDEAMARLSVLALALSDESTLEQVLRQVLAKDPRGERARAAWLDLVGYLERSGRFDEGLAALREAVAVEPGHLRAWLSLADRLAVRRLDDEATWALEQAANSAPDGPERVALWKRLARHARERLGDDDRAEKYEERVERARGPTTRLPGGPLVVPAAPRGLLRAVSAAAQTVTDEAESDAFAQALGALRENEASRPAVAPPLPQRLKRVLEPIVREFTNTTQTRESPALAVEFADDDDIDELSEDTPAAPPEPISEPSVVVAADVAEVSTPAATGDVLAAKRAEAPERPDAKRASVDRPSAAVRADARKPETPVVQRRPESDTDAPPRRAELPVAPAPRKTDVAPAPASTADRPTSRKAAPADVPTPAPIDRSASRKSEPAAAVDRPPSRKAEPASASRKAEAAPAPKRPDPDESDEQTQAIEPTPALVRTTRGAPTRELHVEREALFERVRARPLDPDGYRLLAEHFDTSDDPDRATLMLELARALEGDPESAPRTPRLLLSATDRAALKHSLMRTEAAELMTLAAPALCRLFPPRGPDTESTETFGLDAGKGAKPAAEALLAAVRVLGVRAPEVFVSDQAGPPFSTLQSAPPRLVVTRVAVNRPLADAELRFYAGRALFTVSPELLALRTLKRDQLRAGLEAVGFVVKGQASTEARLLREVLSSKALERLRVLWPTVAPTVELSSLMEGARHSVNRAGLIVCGGIAPVIALLRAKKALPIEVTELVRFAGSDRYLQLRSRKLGAK